MANKWAKLRDLKDEKGNRKIPDAPYSDMSNATDKRFRDKVDDVKTENMHKDLTALFKAMLESNDAWDEAKAREKELNPEFEALGQLIREHFQRTGVTSMRDEKSGKLFHFNIEPYVTVKDREALEKWVDEDPGRQYLWGINHQSLTSLVKTMLEDVRESEIPPCLEVTVKISIRVKS